MNDKNISSIEDVISWLRQNGFEPDAGMLLRIYHIHNITNPAFENSDSIYHFVNSLRAVVCKNEKQQFDFDTATIQLKPFVKPIAKKNWWWWLIPLALIIVMVILFYTSRKYCKHHQVFNDYISCCCTFPVDSVDANILSIRLTDSTVKLYNKTVHPQVKNLWTVRDSTAIAFADSLCDTLILSSRVPIDEEVLLTTEAYDSAYKDSYIIYAPVKCAASFSYVIIDPVSKTVQFENTSTGDSLKYHWDFGDGTNAKDANPRHKFIEKNDAYFSVTLSIANAYCSDSTSSPISFQSEISEIPTVNFPAPPPIDVNIDAYLWNEPYYRFSITQMLISILALLAAVAFYFSFKPKFKTIKNRAAPKKTTGPFYKTLHFPVDKRMYDFEEIQTLIKLWRKRKQTGEIKIDQRKSFEKTIRNAGMLTVVNQDSFKTPEYLLLIKCNNIRNHHYRLIIDLLSYIEKSINIDTFIYDNDIRVLTSYSSGKKYTLKDLHATHVEHRLLIWSDGNELIVPETFDLQREVQNDLNAWRERIIFTPVHPQLWGSVEILLSKLFLVETASLRGLENFLADLASLDFYSIDSKAISIITKLNCVSDYPNLDACYAQLTNAIDDENAEEKIVAAFVDRLEWYYDNNPRVFQLIACCALHEFLYWDLTRKLAIDLYNDASFLTDELIVELNYLKWFREGAIPSLFRNELINRIGANEKIIAVKSISTVVTFNLDNKKITTEQNVKSFADYNLHVGLLGAQSQISNAIVDSNLKTFEPYIYTGTDTVWNELQEQAGLLFPISAKVLLKKVNVYELPKSGSKKLFEWKIKTEVEITEMEGDYFKVRLRNDIQTNVNEAGNNYESAAEIPTPNAESRRTSPNDKNVEQGWCKKSDLLLQGETVTTEKILPPAIERLRLFFNKKLQTTKRNIAKLFYRAVVYIIKKEWRLPVIIALLFISIAPLFIHQKQVVTEMYKSKEYLIDDDNKRAHFYLKKGYDCIIEKNAGAAFSWFVKSDSLAKSDTIFNNLNVIAADAYDADTINNVIKLYGDMVPTNIIGCRAWAYLKALCISTNGLLQSKVNNSLVQNEVNAESKCFNTEFETNGDEQQNYINWYGYFLNAYTTTHYALQQSQVDTNKSSQVATNFAIAYHKLLTAYNADTNHFLAGYYNVNDFKIYVINTFPKIYTDSLKIIFGYKNPPLDSVAKVPYACNKIAIKEFMKRFKATTEINGWDRQKRYINIDANKSVLYYATRNKSAYETYSINSICTNGISYRIIGKRNNKYKTFFVTPNQISRIGNNYISLTVCDNNVYSSVSDAELNDGSNCPVLSIYPYKIKPIANAIIYGDLSQRKLSNAEIKLLDNLIVEMKDSTVDGISIDEYVFVTGNSGLGNILNNSNQSNQSEVNNGYQKLSNYFTSKGIEINNISHLVKGSNPFDNNYFVINFYRTKSRHGGNDEVKPNCDIVFSSLIKALLNPDSVCKLNLSAGMVSKDLKVFDKFKNLQLLDISQNDLSDNDIKQIANLLPKGCKLVSQPQINVKRKIITLNNEVDTLHSQIERFQNDDYYKKEILNKYNDEQNFFNNIIKENSRIEAEIEKIRNSKELSLEKSDFQLIGEVQLNISNLIDKISKLTDTKRNKKN